MEPIEPPNTEEPSTAPSQEKPPFTPTEQRSTGPEESKSPNPTMVLVLSLFGYPGVGHVMVGARTLGAVIVVVFTGLTLGILYEMWIIGKPLLQLMTQGTPMEIAPNWARIGFWIVSTGIVWIGASLHAYLLARKLQ